MKEFYVYRFLDKNNKVLYVGRTNNLEKRIASHFLNKDAQIVKRNERTEHIQYTSFSTKTYSAIYEIFLINLWKPKYNTLDKYNETLDESILSSDNLVWEDFSTYEISDLKEKIYKKNELGFVRGFNDNEIDLFEKIEGEKNITLTNSDKKFLAVLIRSKLKGSHFVETNEIIKLARFSHKTLIRTDNKLHKLNVVKRENVMSGNIKTMNKYFIVEGGAF